jgi:hypothetical protein
MENEELNGRDILLSQAQNTLLEIDRVALSELSKERSRYRPNT